jgi:hypothetical protein
MQRRCKNAAWFALAILLTIGWGAVIWRTLNVPHSPINQSASNQKQRGGNSESQKESAEEAIARYNKWLSIFTAILAVATLGLGGATVGIYFAGEKAVRETRRIGEAQTRAYVSIKTAGVEFIMEMSVPHVSFVASNSGQSPARNFIWNVTLQYAAGKEINSEVAFYDKWLTSTGMDIPAASDAHPEGALVPMAARGFVENVVPGALMCVVRLKIDFRYTDVFERDWFGESYFSGVMTKHPTVSAEGLKIAPSAWVAQISPVPRPGDWDEVRKAQKT